ncbi:hypothetical protein PAN31117_00466 [Pandoraea anapnoica]|uniref:Uncharacterized protein n=1 Tax=Pandoraea anapnoica TaxID=2508301 RepID=A0A5E4ZIZ6_9BURK|nr:hypothetical protein [Pandoraea anapnoica]VVE61104.1 hypothetical protein PAN31117_00466 [Pandoraea anapnoica]
MTCLNKWMIGACVATLSSVAIADGASTGSSEQMMMANLGPSPLPVRVEPPPPPVSVAAVPAVPVTLYPFGREGPETPDRIDAMARADATALLYTRIEAINSATPVNDSRRVDWIETSPAPSAGKAQQSYLTIGPNRSPRLSMVEWNNVDDKLGSDPKRGISLKTDDWTVSASAKVPLLGQHDIGATVYVKRRF